jgi:hypothetical protein
MFEIVIMHGGLVKEIRCIRQIIAALNLSREAKREGKMGGKGGNRDETSS